MLGDMLEIMAMKEDYLGDPVHLIRPIEEMKPTKKIKKKARKILIKMYISFKKYYTNYQNISLSMKIMLFPRIPILVNV